MKSLKKILGGLNAIEKIALVLSFFYGVGVISLIQFNAYYTGGEYLDFLRIKPILVGIQYSVYLLLPALIFGVAISIFKNNNQVKLWLRLIYSVACFLFLMMASSVALHYFVPFTYSNAETFNEIYFYWWVTLQFWSMYFYWDFFHIIGMLSLLYLSWRIVFRRNLFGNKLDIMVAIFCVVVNLHYFNRDVYINIVQSAGGGAPHAGIITIVNPTESMKRNNKDYHVEDNEIVKPCFVLEENSDHLIIAEMFDNYSNRKTLSEVDMRASATRIDRSSVKQFSRINYMLGFKNREAAKNSGNLGWDVIHHLDVVLNISFTPESDTGRIDWNVPSYGGNVTNDMLLSWWDGDNGILSCRSRIVHSGLADGSNVVQQIKFSGVEFPRGVYAWSLKDMVRKPGTRMRIDYLPAIPKGYRFSKAQLFFVCNFIYEVTAPWDGQMLDENTLVVETKGGLKH